MIHITGHSLGAHMAGMIGKHITSGQLDRITGVYNIIITISKIFYDFTGLDPAGPLFLDAPPSERISFTDAAFVDIIHTNGGTLFTVRWNLLSFLNAPN
ncbi:unnamed protein product [Rotaria magnacalcarata]|uniref:Lipase domain-containing protein n=1 Tax=Rotaria magnacalcarata TaxID=392030 RepID=A0A816Z121_9BILA|nr:unnamed protein product [Rotaria magnacalcarata]CAF4365303.1 unnamed protein product [Rotaria magnacalcarata]